MASGAKRIFKIILLLLVVAFIAIQFKRPDRTNPPIDPQKTIEALQQVPPPVEAILQRSCADCHSNQTVWPFYARIAPSSWLVADDVQQGRRHMNLSEWGSIDPKRRSKRLGDICDQVTDGDMPLWQYLLIHRSAKLSPEDVKTLCDWTEAERKTITDSAPAK